MRLERVFVRESADRIRLVGIVERDAPPGRIEVYFEYPIEYRDLVAPSAEAFAVALLVPAMLAGERLIVEPPLSPQLHFQLPRVRDIFRAWNPKLPSIEVQTTPATLVPPPAGRAAGTFFSGGVDSFFTLLRYRTQQSLPAPMGYVIFMEGLEKPFGFARGVEDSRRLVDGIAKAAGVRCVLGSSNLRSYFDADWLNLYCGSGLAASAHSLGGGLSHVCIPSTYSYRRPANIGSTPLTDERLSSEHVQIVHDGAELSRPEKLARLLEWNRDLVLQHLRVCVMNYGGNYNCCRCHKCVRTMVALRVLGALPDAVTFPEKSADRWARVMEEDEALPWLLENLDFARARGADRELIAMLERVVARRRREDALRSLIQHSPASRLLPAIVGTRRRLRALRERTWRSAKRATEAAEPSV